MDTLERNREDGRVRVVMLLKATVRFLVGQQTRCHVVVKEEEC